MLQPLVDRVSDLESVAVSLAVGHADDQALVAVALTTMASRQGRLFDASGRTVSGAGRANETGLEQMTAKRSKMASAFLASGASAQRAATVAPTARDWRELTQLEAIIVNDGEYRTYGIGPPPAPLPPVGPPPAQPPTAPAQLSKLLEPNEVLVSYVAYAPVDLAKPDLPVVQRLGERHYAAFVVRPDREDAALIDLGRASEIEPKVKQAHAAMSNPRTSVAATRAAASALHARIWQPIEAAVGTAEHVFVVPDAALALVPLDALFDGHAWLLERYDISYLISARNLIRVHLPKSPAPDAAPARGQPTLWRGRPRVGEQPVVFAHALRPDRRYAIADLQPGQFPDLPGTEKEAEAIQRHFPSTTVKSGQWATERALLGVFAPRFLHIATHAVYVGDNNAGVTGTRGVHRVERAPVSPARPRPEAEEDWMRAALVVSPPDKQFGEDGPWDSFTTAFEVERMNLRGTRMVVLSGCGTAAGARSDRNGVRSLQRAFLMAGAWSVVASLWTVDDHSVVDLIDAFYVLYGARRRPAQERGAHARQARHRQETRASVLLGLLDADRRNSAAVAVSRAGQRFLRSR
jgi:CHAT domain-containing protein